MKKIACLFLLLTACSSKSWQEASRESVGTAVPAAELTEDILQIYYARAFSWRGYFGVHPWIAWKELGDSEYTVAQVTAWNLRRAGTTVLVQEDLPDRKWFDNKPHLMFELRGEEAKKAIQKVKTLIQTYPYKDNYKVWPGPNSNTFVAYMIRNVEELDIELPAHAIGKDYLAPGEFVDPTASNTGFQLSLFGALGFTLGVAEGVEINILGLSIGLDIWTPALKLPIVGRLGFKDRGL